MPVSRRGSRQTKRRAFAHVIWIGRRATSKPIRIFFHGPAHGRAAWGMRLFPVAFLAASDSNARASIESSMNGRRGDVDTRSSIS